MLKLSRRTKSRVFFVIGGTLVMFIIFFLIYGVLQEKNIQSTVNLVLGAVGGIVYFLAGYIRRKELFP